VTYGAVSEAAGRPGHCTEAVGVVASWVVQSGMMLQRVSAGHYDSVRPSLTFSSCVGATSGRWALGTGEAKALGHDGGVKQGGG
jgi:hypothetical protein